MSTNTVTQPEDIFYSTRYLVNTNPRNRLVFYLADSQRQWNKYGLPFEHQHRMHCLTSSNNRSSFQPLPVHCSVTTTNTGQYRPKPTMCDVAVLVGAKWTIMGHWRAGSRQEASTSHPKQPLQQLLFFFFFFYVRGDTCVCTYVHTTS